MSIERTAPAPPPQPPRRIRTSTTERGDATRARILAAAERLFAERGFSSVSMPVLAKASGITAGAIYKHFESKEQLFFEVVRRAVQSAPVSGLEGGQGAASSISEVVASYTTRRLRLVRQLAVEVHYASARDAKVRRLLRQAVDREIGEIGASIAAAQASGELATGADPHLLAAAVMTFIMGLMHMETLTPQLVGEPAWRDFVRGRVAAMVGGAPS
jgi:AcrR family transcriptional regulator